MSDINKVYSTYTANSIGVSDTVEKHRRYPAQVLGSSEYEGIWNQFTEIFDNARDETIEYYNLLQEAVNKICKEMGMEPFIVPPLEINVNINDDDSVEIEDMGRGVPCGIHPKTGEPAIFSSFENDGAGGKGSYATGAYGTEGTSGMHGAGAAVSKSCTEYFDITVHEGNCKKVYFLQYRKGYRNTEIGDNGLYEMSDLTELHPYPQLAQLGLLKTGTKICYKYDSDILSATMGGTPCPAYNRNAMVRRIQMSMLGINNKHCLQINLNFKGEMITIKPTDMTPEIYLDIEPDSPNLLIIPVSRVNTTQIDKSRFTGRLYLKFSAGNYGFKCKTVVNKLEQKYTKHDKQLEDVINFAYRDILRAWVEENEKKGYRMPHGNSFRPAEKFEALLVMDLPIAEFGGQTKDRLESTEYISFLRNQVDTVLKTNVENLGPSLDYFKNAVIEETRRLKEEEKNAERKKKRAEQSQKELEEERYINTLKDDLIARIDEEQKGKWTLDIKRPKKIQYDKCVVCFFEGDSANIVVNRAIDSGEQIVSIVTKGKLSNIHKNRDKILSDQRIRQLRANIFAYDFAYYIIFVDPDPDGTHIRTQLLRIIEEYRHDMLVEGRVFICRAPYGQVEVKDKPITVKTSVEGKRILPVGHSFVLSYEEMEQAISKGAVKIGAYRGALDVVTQCQHLLPFEKMIKDPLYLVRLKPPSRAQLDMLDDVLSEKSAVRGSVTHRMYTKRQKCSKYITKQAKKSKLKIKIRDMNRPTVCTVTDVPNIKDCYKFMIKDVY